MTVTGAVADLAPWAHAVQGPDGPALNDSFPVDLVAVETSPYVARHKATAVLDEWNVNADHAEIVLLLISELVTNAVTFGKPPVSSPSQVLLVLWRLADMLVIEVSDQSSELPVRRSADWTAESGRGLNLVHDLSREWGYYIPRPGWKTVYCVIQAELQPMQHSAEFNESRDLRI